MQAVVTTDLIQGGLMFQVHFKDECFEKRIERYFSSHSHLVDFIFRFADLHGNAFAKFDRDIDRESVLMEIDSSDVLIDERYE